MNKAFIIIPVVWGSVIFVIAILSLFCGGRVRIRVPGKKDGRGGRPEGGAGDGIGAGDIETGWGGDIGEAPGAEGWDGGGGGGGGGDVGGGSGGDSGGGGGGGGGGDSGGGGGGGGSGGGGGDSGGGSGGGGSGGGGGDSGGGGC
ncbi:hypothetical protein CJ030_MR0G006714 [Morella rubra]|uniref:Uncharacterized protein n=1 Tax=Morella rubra TaxID=262757 RepID=A0A6A1UL27_9ROSI|nr:hypothetical protein CJ030_MR0G006714 [Morella rubra]